MWEVDTAWSGPAQALRQAEASKAVGGVENEARQLRASGRISLAVDFPTEGRVYHFKKLKANATLDLWLRSTESFGMWKCALAFVVLGGLVAGSSRLITMRSARAVQ